MLKGNLAVRMGNVKNTTCTTSDLPHHHHHHRHNQKLAETEQDKQLRGTVLDRESACELKASGGNTNWIYLGSVHEPVNKRHHVWFASSLGLRQVNNEFILRPEQRR